ncbi:hypothetical protein [Nitratireductor sp. XY-223]|uniref:hypothetical protein n=1 Tax=Nitratireductor sp. XY-223 TaxID=2561926 RepID=UPI0010AA703F|nr:hypothetical protein [Nitratireductor sp. XY-223]
MTTRQFDLAGLRLAVSTDTPRVLGPLLSLIGEWEVTADVAVEPQCRLTLVRGPVEQSTPPGDAFFSGTIGDEGPFHLSGDAANWQLLLPGELHARFDGNPGTVAFTIAPACRGETLSIATSFALDHILSAAGHVLVHAACVETPGGGRLVLHAPSGTGKTTTALALVDRGFRLCTDDATVLTPTGDGPVAVRGVPRPIKVHRKTAKLFPWLEGMLTQEGWDENGEQWVQRDDLAASGCLAAADPRPVIAVIALRRSGRPMRLRAVDGAEALTEMIADNINLGSAGLFPGHDRRLDVYSRMLASSARFVLDINGPPDKVAALIDTAVNG